MKKIIYISLIYLVHLGLFEAQAKQSFSLNTAQRVLSYQDLLDEMINCRDSIYFLSNARITFVPEKDQRFIAGEDSVLLATVDSVIVNAEIQLQNLVFERRNSDFQPDFLKIRFRKKVSIKECEVEVMLPFVNCVFDGDISVDDHHPEYFFVLRTCTINGTGNFRVSAQSILFEESIFNNNVLLAYSDENKINQAIDVVKCTFKGYSSFSFSHHRGNFQNCDFQNYSQFSLSESYIKFTECEFYPVNAEQEGHINFSADKNSSLVFTRNHFKISQYHYDCFYDGQYRRLWFYSNTCEVDQRLLESTIEDLVMRYNTFHGLIDMANVNFGYYKSELYFDQLEEKLAVYTFDSTGNNHIWRPNHYDVFADSTGAERFFSMYRRITDYFKNRGNRLAYNKMFVEMKNFETMNLQYKYVQRPTISNWFALNMNRFLKRFSAYGTDPVIAILYSIRVIVLFGLLYLFFHNDWDYSNNQKTGSRLRFMLRYFKKNIGLAELDEMDRNNRNKVYQSVLEESASNQNKVPKFFILFTKWYLHSNLVSEKIRQQVLRRLDVLNGTWSNLDRGKQIRVSILSSLWFISYLLFSLLIKTLNALTLSLNAFTTLGFGNIPTRGMSRYVVILEGFIGWVLMTVFSVTLITQLLQ